MLHNKTPLHMHTVASSTLWIIKGHPFIIATTLSTANQFS